MARPTSLARTSRETSRTCCCQIRRVPADGVAASKATPVTERAVEASVDLCSWSLQRPRANPAARPSSIPRARPVPQENVRSLLSSEMGLRGDTSSNPIANPMASASLDDDNAAAGGNGARSGGSARPQSMVISAAGALSAGALMRRAVCKHGAFAAMRPGCAGVASHVCWGVV